MLVRGGTLRRVRLLVITLFVIIVTSFAPQVPLVLEAPQARIVDPLYSVPIPVLVGGFFEAKLLGVGSSTIEGAWIVAPNLNLTLTVLGAKTEGEYLLINLSIPPNAVEELYDLYIKCGGVLLRSPRSVWVLKEWPKELTFLHFTDIHIGIEGASTYYETAMFILNTVPAMFAVVTGDCVDVGSDIPSLKKFREITNRARKPTFVIPGNHDHAQTDEKSFRERYYGFYIGPATWYRVIGKFMLIGLDTGSEGFIDETQIKWLESVLSENKDKIKIILMHHPFFNYATFGKRTGTWKEIEKLTGMYSSWRDNIDSAKGLLRLVEEYNVTMLLAGHVHGDSTVLYNEKTWFVATTTTCAGVREGDYRGFRIVKINEKGEISQLGVPGKNPLVGFSSFNIELARAIQISDATSTACTTIFRFYPRFELKLENVTIYTYVNATVPKEQYKFYGDTEIIKEYEVLDYGPFYIFKVLAEAKSSKSAKLIVACYEDKEPPKVQILMYTPRFPISGKDRVLVYVKVIDEGYGVDIVKLVCETPEGTRNVPVAHVKGTNYKGVLPPIRAREIKLKAVATDLAGNVGESDVVTLTYKVPEVRIPSLNVSLQCKPEVEVGKPFKLTVTVVNKGNGTAKSISIRVSAPSGIEPRTAVHSEEELKAGKTISKDFEFKATKDGTYVFKVTVRSANHPQVEKTIKVTAKKPIGIETYLPYVVVAIAVVVVVVVVVLMARRRKS